MVLLEYEFMFKQCQYQYCYSNYCCFYFWSRLSDQIQRAAERHTSLVAFWASRKKGTRVSGAMLNCANERYSMGQCFYSTHPINYNSKVHWYVLKNAYILVLCSKKEALLCVQVTICDQAHVIIAAAAPVFIINCFLAIVSWRCCLLL